MDKLKNFFKTTITTDTFMRSLISIVLILIIFYLLDLTGVRWGAWLVLLWNAVTPFVIAYIMAFILSPIVKVVERKIKRRGLAITIVVLGSVFVLVTFVVVAIPSIFVELRDFLDAMIKGAQSIWDVLQNNNFFGIEDTLKQMNINLLDYVSIQNITRHLSDAITQSSSFLINLLTNSLAFFLQALVILILTIYFLTSEQQIKNVVKRAATKVHPNLPRYLRNASHEAQGYVKTFGIIMLSKLPQYMLLFYIFGHRSWFLLGVLNMFAVLVPYIGPVLVNMLALVTALTQGPFTIFGTVFIIGWSSFVDQYFIMPKIYKSQVNIHILVLLLGMVINAALFGLIGVVIAIPQILIIRSIFQTRKQIKEEQSQPVQATEMLEDEKSTKV